MRRSLIKSISLRLVSELYCLVYSRVLYSASLRCITVFKNKINQYSHLNFYARQFTVMRSYQHIRNKKMFFSYTGNFYREMPMNDPRAQAEMLHQLQELIQQVHTQPVFSSPIFHI